MNTSVHVDGVSMAKEGAADAPNDAKVVNEVQVGLLGQKSTEIRGDRQRSGGNWFALEKKFGPSRNTASKARFKKCFIYRKIRN